MTDFTKEELEKIQSAFIAMGCIDQNLDFELTHKIQSMIDNYCEHDCKDTIWQSQVTGCSKCGFPSTVLKVKNDNQ